MTDRHGPADGPLACHEPGFREELSGLGYGKRRADSHLDLLGDLSCWLEEQRLSPAELTAARVTQFLAVRRERGHQDLVTPLGAAPLLDYLRRLDVIPPTSRPVPEGPAGMLLERYRDYLVSERGLVEKGVVRYVTAAALFVLSVASTDGIDWSTLSAADVSRFVVGQCSAEGRALDRSLVSALRSFLRFVQLDGWISLPLAQAVPSVAHWSDSPLPRWVAPDDVKRMLASCDRRTASGRRDYAILTLLVRLGLRACEVSALRLDDIDWRAGELVVHGKGRRDEKLPLQEDVGEALADYLEHGRPVTQSRSVFIRLQAPRRGLTPIGVTCVVYYACDRAGLPRVGAHRLRHTAATQMLRAGAPLLEVGQALRHRAAATTAIYAKVDHATLRGLARPWPTGAA